MIEFTCSLNALLGMAGASSSNGIKQQSANAAVHIRRGERCLQFAAQNGRLIVFHQLADKSDALPEVCWTDEEEAVVSLPLRTIAKEMAGLPKMVVVSVQHTRCEITPVTGDKAKGAWCERWRVPAQYTLFPDMTKLPKPTTDDIRELTGLTPDLDTVQLLMKTAKRLGSGMKQPRFTFFGQHSVESIGVRYGDLPSFYAVMKALPGDPMQCDPPAWLVDRDMIPGMASLSSIFFRQLSESERAEAAAGEDPAPKKKRGRKPKEQPGQMAMGEAVIEAVVSSGILESASNQIIPDYAEVQHEGLTPINSEQPTVRPLEWYGAFDDEGNMTFVAASCQTIDESPLLYRIKAMHDGTFYIKSDAELQPLNEPLSFTTIDEAKIACQVLENEAVTALSEIPEEPDFDDAAVTPPEALPDGDGVKVVVGEETLYMSLEDFAQADNLPSFLAGMSDEHLTEFRGLAERSELVWLGEQIDLEVRRRESLDEAQTEALRHQQAQARARHEEAFADEELPEAVGADEEEGAAVCEPA